MKKVIGVVILASLVGCNSVKPDELVTTDVTAWERGGFDLVMIADFKIKNNTDSAVKDIEITCKGFTESGTKIDSNTRTIYKIIQPGETLEIIDYNMGYLHTDVKSSGCYTVSFEKA